MEAFTAGFDGTDVADECPCRAVAKAGANFHRSISEDDFTLLPEIVSVFDDPTTDYAILHHKPVSARAHGLKVILTGRGENHLGRYRSHLGCGGQRASNPFQGL